MKIVFAIYQVFYLKNFSVELKKTFTDFLFIVTLFGDLISEREYTWYHIYTF
jgi:hypothetical protein